MTETLYRKSWQPLAEADKSSRQVVRHKGYPTQIFTAHGGLGVWCLTDGTALTTIDVDRPYHSYEFLCLEPVEVETGEFPKVI